MKKIWFLSLILIFGGGSLFSEEPEEIAPVNPCYTYYALGLGFPSLFTLDVGKRVKHNHLGWEMGAGFGTSIILQEMHLFVSGIYFPSPRSGYYLGLNGETRYFFNHHYLNKGGFLFTPRVLLGKEFTTKKRKKRFIQIGVGYAHFNPKGVGRVPDISLKYGVQY